MSTDFVFVFPITTISKSTRGVWLVSRGCLPLHGTWSYFTSSWHLILSFIILELRACSASVLHIPSDLILNTVRYHFKRPKEKYKTRTYLKIRGRISCHEELNILRGPVTPTGKIGRQFGNYNVLTISIKESVSIEPCWILYLLTRSLYRPNNLRTDDFNRDCWQSCFVNLFVSNLPRLDIVFT